MPRGRAKELLGLGVLSTIALLAPMRPATAATTITQCTDAALRNAVNAGGDILFGLSCTVVLNSTLTIPQGKIVSIDGNGFSVAIDGNDAVRLFSVTGGTLLLKRLTLQRGYVRGADGGNGEWDFTSPEPGSNGSSGAAALPGCSLSHPTEASAGGTGGAGGVGSTGGNGKVGKPGGTARGAA
jgi:hypothetical protein